MAFANKIGNFLKQSISSSNPSVFQALRCMSSKLFVGGTSYGTDDHSLREAFSSYGEVIEARIIMDRETGRSRGFGFVTYASSEEASAAMSAMDGKDLHGRYIRVNYATERTGGFRSSGGGYGGGGGYSDGSYSGGGYAGGGGYGGSNAEGGGGGYSGSGGGYGGSSGYSGSMGSYGGSGGGNYGVAGGGGGSDGFASKGFGANPDAGRVDSSGFNFNNNPGTSEAGFDDGNQDDVLQDDFKDDDGEPDAYADKRA